MYLKWLKIQNKIKSISRRKVSLYSAKTKIDNLRKIIILFK